MFVCQETAFNKRDFTNNRTRILGHPRGVFQENKTNIVAFVCFSYRRLCPICSPFQKDQLIRVEIK